MLNISEFKKLIGMRIEALFIVLWPPYCEENANDVDVSIGLRVKPNTDEAIHIKISESDNWTPTITELDVCNLFDFCEYNQRLLDWMTGDINKPIKLEIFDASASAQFESVVGSEILDVELLSDNADKSIFAVKLVFDSDYILVSPISDGTTVESLKFNRLNNISNLNLEKGFSLISLR